MCAIDVLVRLGHEKLVKRLCHGLNPVGHNAIERLVFARCKEDKARRKRQGDETYFVGDPIRYEKPTVGGQQVRKILCNAYRAPTHMVNGVVGGFMPADRWTYSLAPVM